jgi:hypothetical protein
MKKRAKDTGLEGKEEIKILENIIRASIENLSPNSIQGQSSFFHLFIQQLFIE